VDSNSPCKDLLLSRGPTLAQKPLNLVGTVFKCTCKHKDKDGTQEKRQVTADF